MTKLSREIVHQLRNQGMTFADIGNMSGVSRQYVYALYSGYNKIYAKTDKYKMYKRHYKSHKDGARPYKPCEYCMTTSTLSMGLSNV